MCSIDSQNISQNDGNDASFAELTDRLDVEYNNNYDCKNED
jgi:hypothetical protein